MAGVAAVAGAVRATFAGPGVTGAVGAVEPVGAELAGTVAVAIEAVDPVEAGVASVLVPAGEVDELDGSPAMKDEGLGA